MYWTNKYNETLYLISIPFFDRVAKPNVKKIDNVVGLISTKTANKVFLIETLNNTNEAVLSSLPSVIEKDVKQINGKIVVLGHSKIMTSSKSSLTKFLKLKLKEKIELYENEIDKLSDKFGNRNPSTWGWHSNYLYEQTQSKIENIRKYYGMALDAIKKL